MYAAAYGTAGIVSVTVMIPLHSEFMIGRFSEFLIGLLNMLILNMLIFSNFKASVGMSD